jgi:hypothetical protein
MSTFIKDLPDEPKDVAQKTVSVLRENSITEIDFVVFVLLYLSSMDLLDTLLFHYYSTNKIIVTMSKVTLLFALYFLAKKLLKT